MAKWLCADWRLSKRSESEYCAGPPEVLEMNPLKAVRQETRKQEH